MTLEWWLSVMAKCAAPNPLCICARTRERCQSTSTVNEFVSGICSVSGSGMRVAHRRPRHQVRGVRQRQRLRLRLRHS